MGSREGRPKKKHKKFTQVGQSDDIKSNGNGNGNGKLDVITDSRFSSVHWDPRFQKVANQKSRVKIDSRFNDMFTDKRFTSFSSAPVDKRGKSKKQDSENRLRHYYQLEDEQLLEEKSVSDEDEFETNVDISGSDLNESNASKFDAPEDASELESTSDEEDPPVDYDDVPEVEVEIVPVVNGGTRRLAVVNMDWTHLRAVDLFVVSHSLAPKGGEVLSVAVYPSEFGLQCMQMEEAHGPVGLFDNENETTNNDDDDDDDNVIFNEKLRAYEKRRLRYYYAIVECDSVRTAEHIYEEGNGLEFERSSNVLDLRFVLESFEPKHPPRDSASEVPSSYNGLEFHTKALQHSNVPLSWDDDEPHRAKALKRKFKAEQLAEMDFEAFIASDESDSDDDVDGRRHARADMYRSLIESCKDADESNGDENWDMEVSFDTGLEDIHEPISQNASEDNSETDKDEQEAFLVRKTSVKNRGNTKALHNRCHEKDAPVSRGSHEQKLKKEQTRADIAELELLLADNVGAGNDAKGYNLKPKKKKGKRSSNILPESKIPGVDYDDPRFSALYKSPLFALDPTNPQFKRSAAYLRELVKKQSKAELRNIAEKEYENGRQAAYLPCESKGMEMKKPELYFSDVLASTHKEKREVLGLAQSLRSKCKHARTLSNGAIPS